MPDLKPSQFCDYPWSSVLQNTESEVVALNIMKIRRRLGDRWEITWDEYRSEREKDGAFTIGEQRYFEKVMPLIGNASGACAFSKVWAKQSDAVASN